MILKEAYRYQNFLTEQISNAEAILSQYGFYTTTKETHYRKKSNPEAGEDETVVVDKPIICDFTPNELIDFLAKALAEKEKLFNAIADAKKKTDVDIDSSLAMNKVRQKAVQVLTRMDSAKDIENKKKGTDYKFNADGNQVSYNYDVTSVTTIDFDRMNVRKLVQKYNKEIDETSAKLDLLELTTEVDFEPTWDVHDTLDNIVVSLTATD